MQLLIARGANLAAKNASGYVHTKNYHYCCCHYNVVKFLFICLMQLDPVNGSSVMA
jgi:hypothetical protein